MNSRTPRERIVPPHIEEAAGEDFMRRLYTAAARVEPMSERVAMAFADGPELSGGLDIEPDDV